MLQKEMRNFSFSESGLIVNGFDLQHLLYTNNLLNTFLNLFPFLLLLFLNRFIDVSYSLHLIQMLQLLSVSFIVPRLFFSPTYTRSFTSSSNFAVVTQSTVLNRFISSL